MVKRTTKYNGLLFATVTILVIGLVCFLVHMRPQEGFVSNACPTMVTRDPSSNEIVVQPGNVRYKSVFAYATAIARTPNCVVMRVPDVATTAPSTRADIPAYTHVDIKIKQQARRDMAAADAIASSAGIRDRAYSTRTIDDVTDYDDTPDLVEKQERIGLRRNEASTAADERMRDWSSYPTTSRKFEQGLNEFREQQGNGQNTMPAGIVADIHARLQRPSALPPNEEKQEAEERASLLEYGPRSTASFWETPLEDVQKLIDDRNKNGNFTEKVERVGPNQFAITKITPKREQGQTVVYDSSARTADTPIYAPAVSAGNPNGPAVLYGDPFFEKGTLEQTGSITKWSDFTRWTPGLERMFAPSVPETNWY